MKYKKMKWKVFVWIGIFTLLGCETASKQEGSGVNENNHKASYTFRLAESQPLNYPVTLGDERFAELVNEKSSERLRVDVFHSEQLGDEKSTIEQLQLGLLEFSRVSSSPLAAYSNDFGVLSLPYVFDSKKHMWNFLEGESGQRLLRSLESSDLYGLSYFDAGSRSLFTKEAVTSVEDLKGLKIRVPQNKINIDLIKSFGAEATPLPYGKVFEALQNGTIDGAENNLPSYYYTKAYQAANYYIMNVHQSPPDVLVISKSIWDRLSKADQLLIKKAADEASKYQRELWRKSEEETKKLLKKSGVQILEVENLKPWKDLAMPVTNKYREEFKSILKDIDQARE